MATDEAKDTRIDAFLRELAAIAGRFTWRVDQYGGIRARVRGHKGPDLCPITAMEYNAGVQIVQYNRPHESAERQGLASVSYYLVCAIDNRNGTVLRDKILKAVGLQD
ncbi:MAG: hypothetical protein AB7I37_26160 [Pirellulales bacterium]